MNFSRSMFLCLKVYNFQSRPLHFGLVPKMVNFFQNLVFTVAVTERALRLVLKRISFYFSKM